MSGDDILTTISARAVVRRLVRERLSVYERMWDGCGCRIDYFG